MIKIKGDIGMSKKITAFLILISMILGTAVAMAQETDDEEQLPVDDLVGTTWQLSTMAGEDVISDVVVTLTFEEGGRANGTAGCNRYNTEYTHDDNALTFGVVATTRMFCSQDRVMQQEAAFVAALESATRYEIFNDLLMIYYGDDQVLDFFRVKSLNGTQWELSTMNQDDLVEDSTITLNFDEEGNAYGSAGCNSYSGSFTVADDNLTFGMLVSTLMACEESLMNQETEYLQILGNIERFRFNPNFTLILSNSNGDELWFNQVHDLLGTKWQLDSIDGQDVVGEKPITLEFEQFDQAYGSACNIYNAFYEVLGEGKITFGIVTSTMMYCSDQGVMEQETAYHGALYTAYAYEMTDEQLIIHYLNDDEEAQLIFSSFATETE
jgi:heat shock protein HslJ